MKNFFKKIGTWCKSHVWQSVLICVGIVCVITVAIVLPITLSNKDDSGSGDNSGQHTHTFSKSWSYDETNHWHAATCEHTSEKGNLSNHIDVNEDFVCDICDYDMPNPSANEVNATEFAEALDFNTLKNFKGHLAYYSDSVNPTSQNDFEQDGNVAKMIYPDEDQYIEYKDGEYILYYYQASKWHKGPAQFYQKLISDSIISWIDTLEYSDFTYNSESKTYSSEIDHYEYELKFDLLGGKKRLVSFDIVAYGSDRYLYEFSSYGDASLVLPEIDV